MMDQAEWVRLLQAGDDDAWREYIRAYAYFVPIVSGRLGLTASDREDVLQDMVVTALRSIHNLRDPSRLGSWTFTIANRAAINVWKARGGGFDGSPAGDSVLASIPSDEIPTDRALALAEDVRHLREAVSQLSELCRQILGSLFFEEPRLTYKEVSDRFGVPIGSIGPNLARCLKRLRRAIRSVSDSTESGPVRVKGKKQTD